MPILKTSIYDETTDEDVYVEVEYDFDEYDPGDAWCPPSGGGVELSEDVYVTNERGKRTGKVLALSDLPEDDQAALRDEAMEEAQEEANERAMLSRAVRYGGRRARMARDY